MAAGEPIGVVEAPGREAAAELLVPRDTGHVGIVGATESGKSHTLKTLARALARQGAAVLVLDWEGEHSDIASHALEPWQVRVPVLNYPDPRRVVEALEAALRVHGDHYSLSPLMAQLLAKTLARTRRRVRSLVEELEKLAENTPRADTRTSTHALLRRLWALQPVLEQLEPGPDKKLDPASPQPGKIYTIDLSGLTPSQKKTYTQLLATHLQANKQATTLLYLAVEEAHHTAQPGTPLEQLLLEARKKNIRLITLTSHPTPLHHNQQTIIAHQQPDTESAKRLAEHLAPEPRAKQALTKTLLSLETGEAIVKIGASKPVLAKIKPI